jgi:hypothetical protein
MTQKRQQTKDHEFKNTNASNLLLDSPCYPSAADAKPVYPSAAGRLKRQIRIIS